MDESKLEIQAFAVLEQAPIGIMLIDDTCIVRVNARLAEWLGCPPEAFAGMTLADAAGAGLSVLFDAAGMVDVNRDGKTLRLRRSEAQLPKGGRAVFFEDCTEQVRLETERDHYQELARNLDTKDPETGLLNRNAILGALDSQVSRSRRYGNALSVIRLRFRRPPDERRAIPLKTVAQELNAELRWADQIGRLDDDAFLLVLPETAGPDAEALAAKLGHDRVAVALSQGWVIEIAVAAWQAGDDVRKLLYQLDT